MRHWHATEVATRVHFLDMNWASERASGPVMRERVRPLRLGRAGHGRVDVTPAHLLDDLEEGPQRDMFGLAGVRLRCLGMLAPQLLLLLQGS